MTELPDNSLPTEWQAALAHSHYLRQLLAAQPQIACWLQTHADRALDSELMSEFLRGEAATDDDTLKLDLALALARNGDTAEAKALIDALPANLGTDERARNANVLIANAAALRDAPDRAELERRIATWRIRFGGFRSSSKKSAIHNLEVFIVAAF